MLTAHSQQEQPTRTAEDPGGIEPETFWMWGGRGRRGACAWACACGGGGGGGGGGVILGEVKARPKDIISFSLDYISKSKVQTSNPSSSPISLDTPARPADFFRMRLCLFYIVQQGGRQFPMRLKSKKMK